MKILVVATKPPLPASDGGRLVLWQTLQALAARGHALHLLAPLEAPLAQHAQQSLARVCATQWVAVRRRSWLAAAAAGWRNGSALSLARHRHAALGAAVADVIDRWQPDVVHAEQLQAAANCSAAFARGTPLLLRMQNVESALWQQTAQSGWPLRVLQREAARLRADEAGLLRQAHQIVALTPPDAAALRGIAPDRAAAIDALAPAFPDQLPAGEGIAGEAAVAVAGSAGWWPNRQGLRWFLDRVMPLLPVECTPCVHVFGGQARGTDVVAHAAPADSADAFPAGAIAAVPLLTGSGIRMRILEAWARGLPVVATTVAATGLAVASRCELLIADTPMQFADALQELRADAALRARLVAGGRDYLQRHHAPAHCAAALERAYARAIGG